LSNTQFGKRIIPTKKVKDKIEILTLFILIFYSFASLDFFELKAFKSSNIESQTKKEVNKIILACLLVIDAIPVNL